MTSTSSAEDSPQYFCYTCDVQIGTLSGEEFICPRCNGGFVAQVMDDESNTSASDLNDSQDSTDMDSSVDLTTQNMLNTMVEASLRNAMQLGSLGGMDPASGGSIFTFSFGGNGPNSPSAGGPGGAASIRVSTLPSSGSTPGASPSPGGSRRGGEIDVIQDYLHRLLGGVDFVQMPQGGAGINPWNFLELHGNTGDYAWGPNGLDNIISQLLGQLEHVGPPPASETAIKNLPQHTITQENVDAGIECSVCMDAFKLGEVVKKLPCCHMFHTPCIEPWLQLHNTCPVCRKLVDETVCQQQPTNTTASSATTTSQQSQSTPLSPSSAPSTSSQSPPTSQSSSSFSLFPFFNSRSQRRGGRDNDDDHTYAS